MELTENSTMMNIGDILQNQLIQLHHLPLNQYQKNPLLISHLKSKVRKKNGKNHPSLSFQKNQVRKKRKLLVHQLLLDHQNQPQKKKNLQLFQNQRRKKNQ
jgi:hypothetical protein